MKVWAPRASRVDIVLADERRTLVPADGGWFALDGALLPDTDYRFALDGGEPLPDPRSNWQPGGVNGPSRTVDHGAHRWTDRAWRGVHLPSAVLYELHVGTFTRAGTFDAAIERLDHIVDLGADVIEVMPVAEFCGDRGWGYDGVALYAPHHAYGGPGGFKRFVDAAHHRGLGVLLDVVYNHLGPIGNWLPSFGPYFSSDHHTPWGAAINLDGPESGPVRAFFIDNALHWLTHYHLDGLRLDAVDQLVDESARHFLAELRDEVDALAAHRRQPLWLVAESDRNDPLLVRSPEAGGLGIGAAWSDDFHHALHVTLTGERDGYYVDYHGLPDLAAALERVFVFDGRESTYRKRRYGSPVGDLGGDRFVVYGQNHDQIGNRALGERLSQLVEPPVLAIAAALVLCSPYVPLLFQGEEWGATTPFQYFADIDDAEIARAVREGRRTEFAGFAWADGGMALPDPVARSTFDLCKLDWRERDQPANRGLLYWYRSLIALRRSRPDLSDGRRDRTSVSFDEAGGWLALHREHTSIAVNFDRVAQVVPLPAGRDRELLLASGRGARLLAQGVVVPARSVAIAGTRAAPA